jgi:hypothetical protein
MGRLRAVVFGVFNSPCKSRKTSPDAPFPYLQLLRAIRSLIARKSRRATSRPTPTSVRVADLLGLSLRFLLDKFGWDASSWRWRMAIRGPDHHLIQQLFNCKEMGLRCPLVPGHVQSYLLNCFAPPWLKGGRPTAHCQRPVQIRPGPASASGASTSRFAIPSSSR